MYLYVSSYTVAHGCRGGAVHHVLWRLHCICRPYRSVVLKLFHVEDPQIDTYQPTDPQLKRYARDPHIRDDFYNSDFQTFSF